MDYKKRKLECPLIQKKIAVGNVVWAKLCSHRWWPAIVITASACGRRESKSNCLWVFWFGDHKISELPRTKIYEFSCNFLNLYAKESGQRYKTAVKEALKTIAGRCNYSYSDMENLISWAEMGFKTYAETSVPNTDIPVMVLEHLEVIRKSYEDLNESNDEMEVVDTEQLTSSSNDLLNKVREGSLKIEDICIACRNTGVEVVCSHPHFEGGLCLQCKERLMENAFAYGDDGKNICCIICSTPGTLVVCDNIQCHRSYCLECIELLISPEDQQKVVKAMPWYCFFCPGYKMEYGLLQMHKDWEGRLMSFFQPTNMYGLEISPPDIAVKRPIRVLSLFDGISTGKLALDSLCFEIEKYFSFEIDIDAINVSKLHHNDSVVYGGDVTLLSEEKIRSICPIDLVIGGSPCNDLSLINHCRKGLFDFTGTGQLFFDFFHIYKTVQRLNGEKHVFFMYENVANMETESKDCISSFLMTEPVLIDAQYFSPQTRARFFWGNIPGMYSLNKFNSQYLDTSLDSEYDNKFLSDYLLKDVGRQAVVDKIRTVTTNRNSLIQDSYTLLMPVQVNGEPDVLWVTELERVFGLPLHYTDTGNLNVAKRRELLGRSWSVQVVTNIFRPLLNFFKSKDGGL